MNSLILVFAASSVGVDYGWQPNQDGDIEYIIQIEPELLDSMRDGVEITSRIDPSVQGVRRFRIRVGKKSLPREGSTSVPADPADGTQNKVAHEDNSDTTKRSPAEMNANMPAHNGEAPTQEPPGAKLEARPLISPDRPEAGGGGGFSLEPDNKKSSQDSPAAKKDSGGGSYTPLKESPTDAGEAGPTPIPDPDRASHQPELDAGTSQLAAQPRKLEPSPAGEPLPDQQASYSKVVTDEPPPQSPSPSDIPLAAEDGSERPWKTLVLICLLLFASVGLNVYLGWIARGIYVRYRTLSLAALDNQGAAAQ